VKNFGKKKITLYVYVNYERDTLNYQAMYHVKVVVILMIIIDVFVFVIEVVLVFSLEYIGNPFMKHV